MTDRVGRPMIEGSWKHWRAAHRGRPRGVRGRMKVRHRTPLGAWWHAREVTAKFGRRMDWYRCYWRDDFRRGQGLWPHWHVGTHDRYGQGY